MAGNAVVENQTKYGITQAGAQYVANQLVEQEKAGLSFPPNYSVVNAVQSAYLMLCEAETRDHKPVLEACTQASIVQALRQMATQGLNPVKKQCYFVAYGNKCKLVPSYFGTLAILNRVKNLKCQPVANVVRQGDIFEYGYDMSTMQLAIRRHETGIENLDNPVIAAYAVIVTDRERVTEVMSRKQLEQAWAQGQSWKSAKEKGRESTTHKNFPEEMAKKSVLNRAAKKLINATDDSSIMCDEAISAFNEAEESDAIDVVAEQVAEDIRQNANSVPFERTAIEQREQAGGLDEIKAAAEKQAVAEPAANKTVREPELLDEEEVPDFMKG